MATPAPDRETTPNGLGVQPVIPDYELLQSIGSGAYGEVWLARSSATGTLRAVKIVHRAKFVEDRPFNREFEGIKKFEEISRSHPSQLAIFHVGKNDAAGCFYYVMELADSIGEGDGNLGLGSGESRNLRPKTPDARPENIDPRGYQPRTLRHDLAHGRLPASRVLELGLTLSEALAHLHAHGLVHRDIKPSNIIFAGGRPKLADIGLVTDAATGDDTRSIVGTEGYLASEGPGTPPADLFALGKVLYEALTGLDRRRYPEMPATIRDWPDRQLAFELNEIILKACVADSRQRYQSAEELRTDLSLLSDGRSVKRQRAWQRSLSLAKKFTLAIAVFAIGATILIPSLSRLRNPPTFIPSKISEANEEYTKGLRALHAGPLRQDAIEHFERAIGVDPTFAEAYARLAHAIFASGEARYMPKARDAAQKAVSLNPNSATAHAMLASIKIFDLDWSGGERERKHAIRMDSKSEEILLESALNLSVMGKTNEALAMLEQARRSNTDVPSNLRLVYSGFVLAWCREFDRAIAAYNQDARGGHYVHELHSEALLGKGDYLNAIRLARLAALERGGTTNTINAQFDAVEKAFQRGGPEAYWKLNLELESSRQSQDHLMRMAAIHARLKQPEQAFRYLRQARQETPGSFSTGLFTNPSFDSLRNEKEFRAIEDELWRKK